MKVTRASIISAIITIVFLAVAYLFAAWAFLLYPSVFEFRLYELGTPFGNAFFSAPLWYCFIVTLITVALAYICKLIHTRTKTDTSAPTKKKQIIFVILFALSIIMLFQPGIVTLLPLLLPYDIGRDITEPVFSMVTHFLSTRLGTEAIHASGVTLQIPIATTNLILHQCVVFICGYFFFNFVKLKQPQHESISATT